MQETFFKRIISKPPVLFPLVALFHLFMLLYTVWIYRSQPFPSEDWIVPLWTLLYFLAWLFVCDLRRWAIFAYLGLTITNIILRYTLHTTTDLALYTHSFFPIDVLFCFFLLVWYKKFR